MSDIWQAVRDLFIGALDVLHRLFDGFAGDGPAWGLSIIALTVIVRVLMIPLAVKQFRSMRAMQELSPKIKAIQKKYKADRELLRKDPEQYKAKRQKMSEEMSALYQEAGVHPAGGCLPLIAQAPIFIALFSVLRSNVADHPAGTALGDLLRSDFWFITPDPVQTADGFAGGLSTGVRDAGPMGWMLIALMAASMFFAQRQTMARNAANADPAQLQQQRIMLIVMPVFLAFISLGFPMGVLIYWVTTNLWQVGQQAFIVHEVKIGRGGITRGGNGASSSTSSPARAGKGKASTRSNGQPTGPSSKGGAGAKGRSGPKGGSGPKKKGADDRGTTKDRGSSPSPDVAPSGAASNRRGKKGRSDHLPSRRSKGGQR